MNIWLPYVRGGSGIDVYTKLLARGLETAGHKVVLQEFPHNYQYAPWLLRGVPTPPDPDIVVANSWNGFAFAGRAIPLVVVEHHCVFDPNYRPYRSFPQALFHETFVRRWAVRSFKAASAIVTVSNYTRDSLAEALRVEASDVIYNGIDTDFYCPDPSQVSAKSAGRFRLLFVGNLSRRKGADLLPKILTTLGDGYELHYTGGLRSDSRLADFPNAHALGRLSSKQLREVYRQASVLIFPSRLEGFGLAAAESMACGTPVVGSRQSALAEIVDDGETGILCAMNDVDAFVSAIRGLRDDTQRLSRLGQNARATAAKRFSVDTMSAHYLELFSRLKAARLRNRTS